MGRSLLPIDPFNPGQVFACVGVTEITARRDPWCTATFTDLGGRTTFVLESNTSSTPIEDVLRDLTGASVAALVPNGSPCTPWNGVNIQPLPKGAPFPLPSAKGDILPARIVTQTGLSLDVHHWGDPWGTPVKWYAGMAGKPGVALLQDALARWPTTTPPLSRLMDYAAPGQSVSGYDARTSRIAIDVGSTVAEQVDTYPYVEVLAWLGLGFARPQEIERYRHRFGIPWSTPVPASILRVVLGCSPLPLSRRTFIYDLVRPPGMYSRFIATVQEETRP
ncbi:MAG: hypothetical protein H6735_24260 [Alphaproteobacteria bacterium]|nr:hypothetical protein [Alphaproteobacteria bacterium]